MVDLTATLCVLLKESNDMSTKAMSLRLPADQAAELEAVARADEMPVAEAVREAIDSHIAARRADEDFQKRLKRRLEEDREVLERLAR
jgi:predicted DNA-binding protein